MTVAELIEKLREMPQDMKVYRPEGLGLSEVQGAEVVATDGFEQWPASDDAFDAVAIT